MPLRSLTRRTFLSSAAAAAGGSLLWSPEMQAETTVPFPQPPAAATVASLLDGYIDSYMAAMNAPGLTLALTDKEKTVRTAGFGFADLDRKLPVSTDHLFQIGSITKSFVGLVILQLRDEGKLDLHAPVLDYLPGLPIVTGFGTVTVHHLLTHSSGLPDNLGVFQSDPAVRLVQGFAPGEHFHYCNAGFDILGLLAAKLDGHPWRIAVAERILNPLGMDQTEPVISPAIFNRSATGYRPYREDEVYPRQGRLAQAPTFVMDDTAGCIASTPGDMAIYARMLLNRGQGPNGRIVSEESFALFSTPHIKAPDFSPTASYGYGIAVDTLDRHRILRHTGGMVAFASSIHVDLDSGVAAFASINAMQGYRPTAVTEYAVRLLRAGAESKPLSPQPSITDARDVDSAADYAGTFTAPDGRKLVFEAQGKRLLLVDGETSIPLQHTGGDNFISTVPGPHARHTVIFSRKPAAGASTRSNPSPPVVEVAFGPEWYTAQSYNGPKSFRVPPEYALYVGRYYSDSAWGGETQVYILKDRLILDGEPLVPLGQALFRAGEEQWIPETAEFLHVFEGKARLLRVAGMDFWRVDVE
jgi:D-alanyl-D-alanine carboxypeptidase